MEEAASLPHQLRYYANRPTFRAIKLSPHKWTRERTTSHSEKHELATVSESQSCLIGIDFPKIIPSFGNHLASGNLGRERSIPAKGHDINNNYTGVCEQ